MKQLQAQLGVTADGEFGPQTLAAVRAFQRSHDLPVTGLVGPQTRAALGSGAAESSDDGAASTAMGASSQVRAIQEKLGITADGIAGPQTRAAIASFQRSHGLPTQYGVGPQTLSALGVSGTTTETDETATNTSGAGSSGATAVQAAMSKVGASYSYGATGPSSFDCSGLVMWAFKQAGVSLPHSSYAQYGMGQSVSSSQIQAGDLVFFNTAGSGASDVGIATGPSTAVSATTHGVMTHAITSGYWGDHFVGARRIG